MKVCPFLTAMRRKSPEFSFIDHPSALAISRHAIARGSVRFLCLITRYAVEQPTAGYRPAAGRDPDHQPRVVVGSASDGQVV